MVLPPPTAEEIAEKAAAQKEADAAAAKALQDSVAAQKEKLEQNQPVQAKGGPTAAGTGTTDTAAAVPNSASPVTKESSAAPLVEKSTTDADASGDASVSASTSATANAEVTAASLLAKEAPAQVTNQQQQQAAVAAATAADDENNIYLNTDDMEELDDQQDDEVVVDHRTVFDRAAADHDMMSESAYALNPASPTNSDQKGAASVSGAEVSSDDGVSTDRK